MSKIRPTESRGKSRFAHPSFGVSRAVGHIPKTPDLRIGSVEKVDENTAGEVGDLVLNNGDNLVYYHTGEEWIPLAVMDANTYQLHDRLQVDDQNTMIRGLDGSINMQVGDTVAMTVDQLQNCIVTNGSLKVSTGSVCFSNAQGGIKPCIMRTVVKDDKLIATVNGTNCVVTVQKPLNAEDSCEGMLKNGVIKESSWVSVTPVGTGSGVPYAWFHSLQKGSLRFGVRCLEGSLESVALHIEIRNSE
jgi:hypothetical protein